MLGMLQNHLQAGYSGMGYDPNMNGQAAGLLRKALESGYAIVNQTGGAALRAQSLEGSLKVTTWTARHLVIMKMLERTPAFSTVEEWTEWSSHGAQTGGFVRENDLPTSSVGSYVRRTVFMKYAATTREISHVMATIHPAHGDNIALETRAGILWLLERMEDACYHGDSALAAASAEGESYDGLDNLIDPTSVIDMEDQPLTQPDIEDAASTLFIEKAYPNSLLCSINQRRDLIKGYFPQGRIPLPMPAEGRVGMRIRSVETGVGDIDLYPSIFLQDHPSPSSSASHPNAPNPPASMTGALNATGNGDFEKGELAGDGNHYSYYAAFGNRFGVSAATLITASVQIAAANRAAGDQIDLTVVNPAAIGTFPPEYVVLYRTKVRSASGQPAGLALYSRVLRVPVDSQLSGGTTVVSDVNLIMPFTGIAYLGQWDPEVITFRELLPMFRLDLGVQALAYRWIVAQYGAPVLFGGKKFLRFINVGPLV